MIKKRKIALPLKKNKRLVESDQRITNETLDDFRQGVIEKGRKFKYPIQYERHKVVINAGVVALLTLVVVVVITWWGLYRANANNLVLFKLTQVFPLSIGKIDGAAISYGDYMAQYRSSMHYYQTKEGLPTEENSLEELRNQFRKQAFDNAAMVAFAKKIAADTGVTISADERWQDIDTKLSYGGGRLSEEAYDEIMLDNYGLNRTEYQRLFVDNPLIVRKVSFAVDTNAQRLADEVSQKIALDGSNFQTIIDEYSDGRLIWFDSGLVKHGNSDGGRALAALQLDLGQVAGPIISTDASGYYFVKLVSKDDAMLRYQSLLVPLTEFSRRLEEVRSNGGVVGYAKLGVNNND